MLLTGSLVLNTKNVIATRACGWEAVFESTTRALLHDNPLTDDELVEALIARAHLEHIVLDRTQRLEQEFQLAYKPPLRELETFYSFNREILYKGDTILWKQLPYKGYDRRLRLRLTITGGVFFEGYATKGEQERIAHCLNYIVFDLVTAFNNMRPLVDAYNAKLPIAARNYVEINRRMIADLRRMHDTV